MRLLYKAPVSLYELNTSKREYYFIGKTGDSVKEMVFRVKLTDGIFSKDEQYKLALAKYIPETNRTKAEMILSKMEYNEKDFIKLFRAMYGEQNATVEKTKVKVSGKKDITAGISYLSYKSNFKDVKFSSSPGAWIGIGYTFSSSRNFGKLQSRAGINMNYMGLKWVSTSTLPSTTFEDNFITVEPCVNIGYVFNPLSKTKSIVSVDFGFHFILGKGENIGAVPKNGAFASGALAYALAGKFGKVGVEGGLFSNLLNSAPGGPAVNGRHISLFYSYGF